MPPTSRDMAQVVWSQMKRRDNCGCHICQPTRSWRATWRTTSGRWETRGRVDHALRSTTTASAAATPPTWSTWTTRMCSRCGTSCSSSLTARRTAACVRCPTSTWTLAWASRELCPSSRTSGPTMTPTCSCPYSRRFGRERAPGPTRARFVGVQLLGGDDFFFGSIFLFRFWYFFFGFNISFSVLIFFFSTHTF